MSLEVFRSKIALQSGKNICTEVVMFDQLEGDEGTHVRNTVNSGTPILSQC